ncbi:MAG: CHASE2 domain-containing protein [Nitrospirae bacterium]|nr:CHASE2 domain-containing protein [Nitrospirota bacterium]
MKAMTSKIPDWAIGTAVMLFVMLAFGVQWYPFQKLEYLTYDLRGALRQKQANTPVVIVGIDEISIEKLGRWPLPRTYVSDMVRKLGQYKAKAVGVGIIYSESENSEGLSAIRDITARIDKDAAAQKDPRMVEIRKALIEAELKLSGGAAFADVLESSKNVILPLSFQFTDDVNSATAPLADYMVKNSIRADAGGAFMAARGIVVPAQDIADKAIALGHLNIVADRDGVVRSEPLFILYKDRLFPSFALALALSYQGYGINDIQINNDNEVRANKITIPINENGKMLISYTGKSGSVPYYSFLDVMNDKVAAATFSGKIVLIGLTATVRGAVGATPLRSNLNNVEITATVVENILNANHIRRPGWLSYFELAVMALFGGLIAFLIPRLRAGVGAAVTAGVTIVWGIVCIYLFYSQGLWIKMTYPIVLLFLGYTAIALRGGLPGEGKTGTEEADNGSETNKMPGLSFQGEGQSDAVKKLKASAEAVVAAAPVEEATVIMDSAGATSTLGRYVVLRELGRGAMGVVYLGKDPKINRDVAIKTLSYEDIDSEQVEEIKTRFFREAEAAGKLSHPNIVRVYDVGEDKDIAYMAMELLEGADLARYCAKDSRLPFGEVLRVVTRVGEALDYAHLNGVVHRDIKPANIMLLNNKELRVTDFGIARVMESSKTQTGMVLGTPSYMSPEQIAGRKVDGRSDLFSLGVVFFELLVGERPFKGDSIATLMYNITGTAPTAIKSIEPRIPSCVAEIIDKLLQKNAADRFSRGKDLIDAINRCKKTLVKRPAAPPQQGA